MFPYLFFVALFSPSLSEELPLLESESLEDPDELLPEEELSLPLELPEDELSFRAFFVRGDFFFLRAGCTSLSEFENSSLDDSRALFIPTTVTFLGCADLFTAGFSFFTSTFFSCFTLSLFLVAGDGLLLDELDLELADEELEELLLELPLLERLLCRE